MSRAHFLSPINTFRELPHLRDERLLMIARFVCWDAKLNFVEAEEAQTEME
jgi:hypothetical protein